MEQIVVGLFYIVFFFGITAFVFLPRLYKAARTGEIKTKKATYTYAGQRGMFLFLVAALVLGSIIVLGTVIYLSVFFMP